MFILQVQIVAVRDAPPSTTMYIIVRHEAVQHSTAERKVGVDLRAVYQQHFVFPIVWDPLVRAASPLNLIMKNKDTIVGEGVAVLPENAHELMDIWIPLTGNGLATCELHLCLEIEALGDRNLNDIMATNAYVAGRRKSSGGFGSILRLSKRSPQGNSHVGNGGAKLTGSSNNNSSSSTSFAGKVGAVTLNELVDSLNRLKCCIYLVGPDVESLPQKGTPERRIMLHNAQRELDSIETQIAQVPNLGEWTERLVTLTREYGMDCTDALSEETWKEMNKRVQSVRLPPPLPSKEIRDRVRSERKQDPSKVLSSPPPPVVSVEMSPKTPSIPTTTHNNNNDNDSVEPDVEMIPHHIESMEAFDALMQVGYVLQPRPATYPMSFPQKGDAISIQYKAYLWDPTLAMAISFSGFTDDTSSSPSSQQQQYVTLSWVLGERPRSPKVARGLDYAIINSGVQAGSQVVVTLADDMGFDEGIYDIPPNTMIILVITVMEITAGKGGSGGGSGTIMPSSGGGAGVGHQNSPKSRHRKFPARVPTLVLREPITQEQGDEDDLRLMEEMRKGGG